MKCKIISFEWKQSDNGNWYCKLNCKPDNDVWASAFTYVFFVRTEDEKSALENNMPSSIHLLEKVIPMPKFNRAWRGDDGVHAPGQIVERKNRDGVFEAAVYDSIKVTVRCLPDGVTLARGEDPEKLAMQAYDRGVADGTIIPLDEEESGFDNISSGIDPEPEVKTEPVQQTAPTTQRPGQQFNPPRR